MNWITLLELVLIHGRVIEKTGGVQGITNPGGLESALARPFTTFVRCGHCHSPERRLFPGECKENLGTAPPLVAYAALRGKALAINDYGVYLESFLSKL